jgi:hypothetical protein
VGLRKLLKIRRRLRELFRLYFNFVIGSYMLNTGRAMRDIIAARHSFAFSFRLSFTVSLLALYSSLLHARQQTRLYVHDELRAALYVSELVHMHAHYHRQLITTVHDSIT